MGLTRLCDLDVNLKPQKWSDSILESYTHLGNGTLPDYITVRHLSSFFRAILYISPINCLFLDHNKVKVPTCP